MPTSPDERCPADGQDRYRRQRAGLRLMTMPRIAWVDRLTRLALTLMIGAVAYGVVAGAVVAMYYDVVADMGAMEDTLTPPQSLLFLLAALVSLVQLPPALAYISQKRWRQALIRLALCFGPLFIFLGTDGLIAHLLWWQPISDTDRFHLLHHTVFAGIPLTLGYGLLLHHWWRPADFASAEAPSRRAWMASVFVLVVIVGLIGMVTGLLPPPIIGAVALIGLVALAIAWRSSPLA